MKKIGIAVLLISILVTGCGKEETPVLQENQTQGRDERVNQQASETEWSTETIENAGQYAELERLLQNLKRATD